MKFKDLRSALSESKAKWKIVVGHHGIRTTGHHCDTPELVTHLLPLLEVYSESHYACETSKNHIINSSYVHANNEYQNLTNSENGQYSIKYFRYTISVTEPKKSQKQNDKILRPKSGKRDY